MDPLHLPSPAEHKLTRATIVAVLAIVLVHGAFAWMGRSAGIGWGEDDAQYFHLAKALSHFSYREPWDIGAPLHARYPPLLPAMLAAVGVVSGWSVNAMLFFIASCSALSLVLFFDAARRRVGVQPALLALLVCAVNPMLLADTSILMSEAPFRLFLFLALWALVREDEGARFSALAFGALIAATLTRSAGLVLIVALVLYWLVRRRYRWAAWFAVATVLTVGAWMMFSFMAPDAANHRLYVADLKQLGDNTGAVRVRSLAQLDVLRRLLDRLPHMATVMVPYALSFRTIPGTIVDNVAWLGLLLLTGTVGFVQLARRWMGAAVLLGAYLALVAVWTWAVERFLSPIIPLLYLCMLLGVAWWCARFLPRARTPILLGTTVLLLLGPLPLMWNMVTDGLRCDRTHPSDSRACYAPADRLALKMAAWVRDSTPTDAIVLTSKEAAFYYHSGRRVVNQLRAMEEDSTTIIPFLRSRGVSYVVLSPVGSSKLHAFRRLVTASCRDLLLEKSFPEGHAILRVRRADEASDDRACRALEPWRPR